MKSILFFVLSALSLSAYSLPPPAEKKLYTFSPADPNYIVTVPLFDTVTLNLGAKPATIIKKGKGRKITSINWNDKNVDGNFIDDVDLKKGKTLTINTR